MSQHNEKRHRRETPVNRLSRRVRFLKPFVCVQPQFTTVTHLYRQGRRHLKILEGGAYSPVFRVHQNNGSLLKRPGLDLESVCPVENELAYGFFCADLINADWCVTERDSEYERCKYSYVKDVAERDDACLMPMWQTSE
ncbi:hypothetical protein CBL_11433 [Carabus blaptoides fortunei]